MPMKIKRDDLYVPKGMSGWVDSEKLRIRVVLNLKKMNQGQYLNMLLLGKCVCAAFLFASSSAKMAK